MVREIKRFLRGKKTMKMENRVVSMQDLANLSVETFESKHSIPPHQEYDIEQLRECYQYLIAMTEREDVSFSAIVTVHNQAAKMLRGLKKRK